MNKAVICNIPHSSTVISRQYIETFRADILPHELDVMMDCFCDELLELESERIVFPVNRQMCNVERFRDDKDENMAKVGMDATYTIASDFTYQIAGLCCQFEKKAL